jgi:magnesium transporter
MIRVRAFENGVLSDGAEGLLEVPGVKWIDVLQADLATMTALAERFALHRLAVEDCLHLDQRPKLEEYPGHQFIVLQGFTCPGDRVAELEMHELHMFLGPDWLISVHEKPHESLEALHRRMTADPANTVGRGADYVAYLLADALVDRNFPLLDLFNDAIEGLEERIFTEAPTNALMQGAFELKRSLTLVRRVLSPQRDVVGLLARHGVAHVQERTTLYFRDVYDHLVRIYEQIDTSRDLVGNAVDAYLSVVANRTSDISKQLTIFASIFMPLSFIVGFFGQNFAVLGSPPFFFVMLGLTIALPATMLWWFHRKDWL